MTVPQSPFARSLEDHYLLYIDILGFADLVEQFPERVEDLFQIVSSLNVHDHPSFSAIAFSDTLLVHNAVHPSDDEDRCYIVMYLCEFYQDLVHRLTGRGVWLRGVLTYGPFCHYELNGIPYFYGPALNRAYRADKSLNLTGLVMDEHCRGFSHIFGSRPIENGWNYVFVTQGLDEFEDLCEGTIPATWTILEELGSRLGRDLERLAGSLRQSKTHPDERVRQKHLETLRLFRLRYPKTFATLEHLEFRMEILSDKFNWDEVRELLREDYSWVAERRPAKLGGARRRSGDTPTSGSSGPN